jgi:hypothetical protein
MEDAGSSGEVARALCHRALRLSLRLEGIVRANLGELDRVGWLRRRSARRHFAVATGQPAEAWLAEAAEMARRLDRALASDGAATAQVPPSALRAYAARLRRLAAFNETQEVDARRRYLDAETLDRVLEALHERRQTTLELAETTEALAAELEPPRPAGSERSRR